MSAFFLDFRNFLDSIFFCFSKVSGFCFFDFLNLLDFGFSKFSGFYFFWNLCFLDSDVFFLFSGFSGF